MDRPFRPNNTIGCEKFLVIRSQHRTITPSLAYPRLFVFHNQRLQSRSYLVCYWCNPSTGNQTQDNQQQMKAHRYD